MEQGERVARRAAPRPVAGRRTVRLGAVVAVAVAAGVGAWLATSGGDGKHPATKSIPGPAGPVGRQQTVPVTPQGLRTLAGVLKQPIYWAGPKSGYTLELTRAADGRVYIRYLPRGTKIGTDKAFLTIGTYPLANAFAATASVAARSGSVKVPVQGGIAFYSRQAPTSVYVAYPGSDVQIEVYDPWAPGARKLVGKGQLTAVAGATAPNAASSGGFSTAPQALTLAQLRSFARKVAHPVYWVGPKPGTTYEVTQTTQGRIFVRYLPAGVAVGTTSPYLTVGTYPVRGALSAIQRLSAAADAVKIPVGGGAAAFYARSRPTNVYEAFPQVDYELEIYAPSPSEARRVVVNGKVTPIG